MRLSGEGTATGQRGEGPNVQRRRGQQKMPRRGRSLRGRRDRSIVSRGTRCREANEDPETTTRLGHTDAKGDVTGSCFDGTGGGFRSSQLGTGDSGVPALGLRRAE